RFGVARKSTGENATFAGMRAGELLHAARQAPQSLRCCVGAGWWSPEPSAVQMIASGSNPEWPATTKPAIKACSAIAYTAISVADFRINHVMASHHSAASCDASSFG